MRMRRVWLLAFGFSAFLLAAQELAGSKVQFVDAETARRLLSRDDAYLAALSPFDMSAILKTLKEVSLQEYKDFVGSQTREWSDAERGKVLAALLRADQALAPWKLSLPAEVYLAKTTGEDYCNKAYCRGSDLIVLPQSWLEMDEVALAQALIRQSFHLFLRLDPATAARLYALIGFRRVAPLEYPERFLKLKISNPNSPVNEWAFSPKDAEGLFIPIFQAKTKYNGGELFSYLTVNFLSVREEEGKTIPALEYDRMIQVPVSKLHGFAEATGTLSSFLPQPAELMAENFLLLAHGTEGVQEPRILDGMAEILKNR